MSQTSDILKALRRGRKITALDALTEFGCFRLSARILELREQGFGIHSKMIKSENGKRFAQYSL